MNPEADVYKGNTLVGHLARTQIGTRFWFTGPTPTDFFATQLSVAMESPALPAYFLNLLPEGARLRMLLESAKSKDDLLDVLLRVGWDSVGDIAVLPHGAEMESASLLTTKDFETVSFWELFSQSNGDRAAASVPGVQEKISDVTVAFGLRSAGVPTAMLKLSPPAFPRLVENEAFFLNVARECGLLTAEARLVKDRDGELGLLVKRFDRRIEGKLVTKLHQEDACQLLDIAPANKYNVSIRDILDAIRRYSSAPLVETRRLIQLVAFSYLIGNGDLHAKNVSLLWTDVVSLTPAYDLLSTLPYPKLDTHMALKLDGKDSNFRSDDFVQFGARYGLNEKVTRSVLDQLCTKLEPWLGRLDEIGFDAVTTQKLRREITRRIEQLKP